MAWIRAPPREEEKVKRFGTDIAAAGDFRRPAGCYNRAECSGM